ncbi:hypothetical protein Afil01_14810 [Actinorhabdospora filicis]|uniref:Uncharacterized protein n=1 Tax=Actinorhabdospora filicis TaxID=1785913 RepID=A0A9W6SJE4_9ACTN|nr:hypothetical protein [Actinorhabdospora filicis]GLZ76674.1 hypothetical protein Afil01_14810 [Actinorhabdospora filicis]
MTEELLTVARLLVHGRFGERRRLIDDIDRRHAWDGYGEFLAALFYLAVARRFPEGAGPVQVALLVREVRDRWDPGGLMIDPYAVAALIGSVFGDADATRIDPTTVGQLESLLVHHLLAGTNEVELDDLFARAEKLAA